MSGLSRVRTLGRDDLVARAGTLAGRSVLAGGGVPRFPFAARMEAAAQAGYSGVGLTVLDVADQLRSGHRLGGLASMLDVNGLVVDEIEAAFGWADPRADAAEVEEHERALWTIAEVLQAHHVVACEWLAPGSPSHSLDELTAAFASLCRRAAEHGLAVALEGMPFTTISDLLGAWQIVRDSTERNGGVLVDAWHLDRSGADARALEAIPAERIIALQINDGRAPQGTLIEDAMSRRLPPGSGEFDLQSLIQIVDAHQVDVPIGVEVIGEAHYTLPLHDAAAIPADATRDLLTSARKV